MGLDMGLSKKVIEDKELAYWRKANQIREWFSNNLEDFNDNGETKVAKEDLENLIEVCREVSEDHNKASELLPYSEGFFFGGTEYDEYYFEQIEETIEQINSVLETTDWDKEEIYYWEWY